MESRKIVLGHKEVISKKGVKFTSFYTKEEGKFVGVRFTKKSGVPELRKLIFIEITEWEYKEINGYRVIIINKFNEIENHEVRQEMFEREFNHDNKKHDE